MRVIESDVFAELDELRRDYQLIVLSGVVTDFRTPQQLRVIFELATDCLAPGGRLVFNAFLARPPYVPDDAALELGQQCYTSIFTRAELRAAASGLPLRWISDDSVFDYERAHLPDGALAAHELVRRLGQRARRVRRAARAISDRVALARLREADRLSSYALTMVPAVGSTFPSSSSR